MPRIEIIPLGWEKSREKDRGEGTPTEDVCASCATSFSEGEPLDQGDSDVLTVQYPGAMIGSTDCGHPSYDDCGYFCCLCGQKLAKEDD